MYTHTLGPVSLVPARLSVLSSLAVTTKHPVVALPALITGDFSNVKAKV